jgi:hypothetical protein
MEVRHISLLLKSVKTTFRPAPSLASNIRLGRKWLAVKKTSAYCLKVLKNVHKRKNVLRYLPLGPML